MWWSCVFEAFWYVGIPVGQHIQGQIVALLFLIEMFGKQVGWIVIAFHLEEDEFLPSQFLLHPEAIYRNMPLGAQTDPFAYAFGRTAVGMDSQSSLDTQIRH